MAFPTHIYNQLKYYVYRLIDPRSGETFYIGKGKGNRVFDHAKISREFYKEAEENPESAAGDRKIKTIQEILAIGLEVQHVIHRYGMDEYTALEVEAALIDAYPSAANKVAGHDCIRGAMHAEQVIMRLAQ